MRYTTDIKRSSFFYQYIKDIRMVGAVAPSSRYLAKKMLADVDFSNTEVVVEYGPGTGVFTREITARLPHSAKLLVIETNQEFYERLSKHYSDNKQVIVVHDSAEHVAAILSRFKLAAPGYVISGLPFAALPADVSHAILQETVRLLDNRGAFITFQYTLFKKKLFRHYFDSIRTTREPRNIPPAYVLYCTNK